MRATPAALSFPHAWVDAGGTRLRLRALHVMGHGPTRLARATGTREKTIRALVDGDAKTVTVRLRDAVIAAYDGWWDKRAPARTRAERGAAQAARQRAISGNWCAAAALDDDKLDVPGYQPAYGWRAARGTGVAADIHSWDDCARDRPDPYPAAHGADIRSGMSTSRSGTRRLGNDS